MFFQLLGRALADVRKQADQDISVRMKLNTRANATTTTPIPQSCSGQLQEEQHCLPNKVSSSLSDLKVHQQKAPEDIDEKDRMIQSLHRKVEALQDQFHQSQQACGHMKARLLKAEETVKWRDAEVLSLKRSLQAKEIELEEIKASQDSKNSQASEEDWKEKAMELKERLRENEEEMNKVQRKFNRRTAAHIETIALLTSTENALKEEQEKCAVLEDELLKIQPSEEQIFQQEVQKKQESFMEELSQTMKRSEQQLIHMCQQWEAKEKILTQFHAELDEKVKKNEDMCEQEAALHNEEIQRLKEEVVHLQQSMNKKQKKKKKFSLWCCFFKKQK